MPAYGSQRSTGADFPISTAANVVIKRKKAIPNSAITPRATAAARMRRPFMMIPLLSALTGWQVSDVIFLYGHIEKYDGHFWFACRALWPGAIARSVGE